MTDRPRPCPDRPRAHRPGRPRLGPAPRAHRDRALAHPEPLGLLGAAARRARDRRGARGVPGGRRRDGRRPHARPASGGIRRWLVGLSEATGLHVVMGAGWYRDAYYPAEALIDRRSVDSLADEIVREATEGVGETGIRPGIIGEIGTDKPWISPREERVHRAAARAARRTGLAITTHASSRRSGLDQLDVFEAEGADLSRVVIGHADSNPSLDYHLAIVERGASIEFDFLGMSFTPLERHGEGRVVESICELLARGHVERILLSQDVCHDCQLKPLRRQRLHLPRRRVPAAAARGRRVRRRDPDDHGRQPAAAADDRRRPAPPGAAAPRAVSLDVVASTESSTLPASAREIGQPSFAASAAVLNDSSVAPGHVAADRDAGARHRPAGARRLSAVTSTETESEAGGVPAFARMFEQAIEKQEACAAARSSSGVVIASVLADPRCPADRQVDEDPGRRRGHRAAALEQVTAPGRFGSCRRCHRASSRKRVIGRVGPSSHRRTVPSAWGRAGAVRNGGVAPRRWRRRRPNEQADQVGTRGPYRSAGRAAIVSACPAVPSRDPTRAPARASARASRRSRSSASSPPRSPLPRAPPPRPTRGRSTRPSRRWSAC